jgi:hypothetical protein
LTVAGGGVRRGDREGRSAVDDNERDAARDEGHEQADDCDIREPLAGIEVTLVARESPGEGGNRQAHEPAQVAWIQPERLAHEGNDPAHRERQRGQGRDEQHPAGPHVQAGIRDSGDSGNRRGVPLAAGQQPPAGREEEEGDQVDRRVVPPRRARIALDRHGDAQ